MSSRPSGHILPKAMQEAQRSASVRVPDTKQRLSHAEKTRNLLQRQKSGVLSTSSVDGDFPFGSIINYALDKSENVFFFASSLAEHTANLQRNSKASLFVSEELGDKTAEDQLAVSRATVVGEIKRVEKTQELVEMFKQRHPRANYVLFEDFSAYAFSPVVKVRFIAGFGEMSWVDAAAFAAARSDPVALGSSRAVDHMNADHADANLNMVNAFAGLPMPATAASMLQLDRYGMDFVAITGEGKRMARVNFEQPLTSPDQVKAAVVALSKKAKV